MIVVTGANGRFGRGVVEQLLERVPAEQIAVSVRDPDTARELADSGVRVRAGDFDDPTTLRAAFEGAEQVLVVSTGTLGEAGVRRHRAAFAAAVQAGATHVLYTSHSAVSPTSRFPPMHTHAATEAALEELDVRTTALRNGFYMSTVPRLLGSEALAAPADGPVAWTAEADLTEAAARILAGEGPDDPRPRLTATETLDLQAVAEIASQQAGRPVRRVVVPDEEYRAQLPEGRADILMGMFLAAREGELAEVDPALTELLGRPPITLRELLAAGGEERA